MSRLVRWGLPVVAVGGAVGWLVYSATGTSAEYYVTIAELNAHPVAGDVRVLGTVGDDVERLDGGREVRFTASDAGQSMPVDYRGTLPDIFKAGQPVVVEGHRDAQGVFRAKTLLAKCPSRFTAASPSPG